MVLGEKHGTNYLPYTEEITTAGAFPSASRPEPETTPSSTIFRKDRYIYMELKFVIPNMEKTFGNLEFAGEDKTEQRRINGRMAVLSRSFNLYSDVQRADDIVVILPAEAGEKHFDFEERVKLINPRITAEGYKIGTRGFTNYILHADDMVKA